MAKKKKKESSEDIVESYSLDDALKGSKKTETDLQGLLKGFSEQKGIIEASKPEEKIKPQLSYESKKRIAEAYVLEDIPIARRESGKQSSDEQAKEEENIASKIQEAPTPRSKTPSIIEKPSFSKDENIYLKLADFFEELFQGYNIRYERWENSVSSILAILRKMRKITKKNTEDLVASINNMHNTIKDSLEQFKLKREDIEKVTGVDIQSMSIEFKKVLGLLEAQVKEYQLKRITDEFIHQQRLLSSK
jgi:hypothetical protein